MMNNISRADVLIVGGGIVGHTLANLLAESELSVVLIDAGGPAQLTESFDPRVVALSKESEALMARIGVWEGITNRRACPYFDMRVWDGEGTGRINFSHADTDADNLGHIVEHSALVFALETKASAAANIEIAYDCKLDSFHRENGHMAVTLDTGEEISAQMIVAADGANSPLRTMGGFAVREWDYGHSAIVTTVESERDHEFTAWQRFDEAGPLAFLPLSRDLQNQKSCSIVWSIEDSKAQFMMGLSDEEFCHALGCSFEHRLGQVIAVDRRHSFPLRQRHAQRYSQAGLVLVGDAAHTIHPLAGQGANLGIYDVQVLANEICRAHERGVSLQHSSVGLRYERQRQPHNLAAMVAMEGFKRAFGSDSLSMRWLRNEGLRMAENTPWLRNQFAKMASGQKKFL